MLILPFGRLRVKAMRARPLSASAASVSTPKVSQNAVHLSLVGLTGLWDAIVDSSSVNSAALQNNSPRHSSDSRQHVVVKNRQSERTVTTHHARHYVKAWSYGDAATCTLPVTEGQPPMQACITPLGNSAAVEACMCPHLHLPAAVPQLPADRRQPTTAC